MKKYTIILAMLFFGFTASNFFANGVKVFKSKCGHCHALTFDGKKVTHGSIGANLTGVAQKYPEDFIKMYMTNPVKARKKFAKICSKLLKKCGKSGVKMPAIPVRENQVNAIYEILK